jgi:hypothetical protein
MPKQTRCQNINATTVKIIFGLLSLPLSIGIILTAILTCVPVPAVSSTSVRFDYPRVFNGSTTGYQPEIFGFIH